MENVKNIILNVLIENKVINEDDRDIYEFGLVTMFFTLGKLSLLLLLFNLLGEPSGYIAFILGFSILRYFSGGYHVSSALLCTVLTFSLIFCTIKISKYCFNSNLIWIPIICTLISIPIIFKYAPSKVKNRPLNSSEKEYFKNKSRKIVVLFSLIILILTMGSYEFYEIYVFGFALLFQSLNIISRKEEFDETITVN